MLLLSQFLTGLLGLHWITVATKGGLIEFLIFIGFISGMVATLPSTVIPFISPDPSTLGTRIGVIYACAGFGVLIGNPVALAATGDTSTREGFLGAQLWMGICALIATAFFILPTREAHKNWMAAMRGSDGYEVDVIVVKTPGLWRDLKTLVGWTKWSKRRVK